LRDASRFKNWFYRIVFNVCHTWLRVQKSQVLSLESLGEDRQGPGHRYQDPQEIVEVRELQQLVREAVNTLSPRNRVATWLFYYEQLSIVEIAANLSISQTAVKNRLHRGRNELRKYLKPTYPEVEQMKMAAPGKRKRKIMVQVTIMRVIQQGRHTLVVLFDEQELRALPLWLQREESQALLGYQAASSLQDVSPHDPSPIDLLVNILNATGDAVEEVRIDTLQEEILYATVRLRHATMLHEIKARVGEALSLAVRVGCLIFVAKEVLDRLGMKLPVEEGRTREQQLATLEEDLWHYLPPPALIAGVADIPKHPRNLDFQEGVHGWQKSQSFEFGRNTAIKLSGEASVSLWSKVGETKGLLAQAFLADDYRGKRMRLACSIKTQNVVSAGLRITLEGLNQTLYKASKMIEGTQDWTLCTLEVDVPMATMLISISLLMIGTGPVWLDALQFEEVPEPSRLRSPQNLNFEHELQYWEPSDQVYKLRGNLAQGYNYGIDRQVRWKSVTSTYLKADIPEYVGYLKAYPELAGSGVLKQVMLADDYRGKRLRLSGSMKTEGVKHRAGLFLGVAGPEEMLSLDEMQDRPIQETQDWKRYEVAAIIPKESEFITFGVVLYGKGQVWLEDVHLEVQELGRSKTGQREFEGD
jgi:RNA polymerase sigma factor (sigma-70 family)